MRSRKRSSTQHHPIVIHSVGKDVIAECLHIEPWRHDSEPHIGTQRIYERGESLIFYRFCDECKAEVDAVASGFLSAGFEYRGEVVYAIVTPQQSEQWAKQNGYGPGHSLKGNPQA